MTEEDKEFKKILQDELEKGLQDLKPIFGELGTVDCKTSNISPCSKPIVDMEINEFIKKQREVFEKIKKQIKFDPKNPIDSQTITLNIFENCGPRHNSSDKIGILSKMRDIYFYLSTIFDYFTVLSLKNHTKQNKDSISYETHEKLFCDIGLLMGKFHSNAPIRIILPQSVYNKLDSFFNPQNGCSWLEALKSRMREKGTVEWSPILDCVLLMDNRCLYKNCEKLPYVESCGYDNRKREYWVGFRMQIPCFTHIHTLSSDTLQCFKVTNFPKFKSRKLEWLSDEEGFVDLESLWNSPR